MTMPPVPKPIHASEVARAGTERSPPVSAAIVLSATMVIHGAPNDTARITSMTVATIQDDFVSMERSFICSCIGCYENFLPSSTCMLLRRRDQLDRPFRRRVTGLMDGTAAASAALKSAGAWILTIGVHPCVGLLLAEASAFSTKPGGG